MLRIQKRLNQLIGKLDAEKKRAQDLADDIEIDAGLRNLCKQKIRILDRQIKEIETERDSY